MKEYIQHKTLQKGQSRSQRVNPSTPNKCRTCDFYFLALENIYHCIYLSLLFSYIPCIAYRILYIMLKLLLYKIYMFHIYKYLHVKDILNITETRINRINSLCQACNIVLYKTLINIGE